MCIAESVQKTLRIEKWLVPEIENYYKQELEIQFYNNQRDQQILSAIQKGTVHRQYIEKIRTAGKDNFILISYKK